jgi:hypothetical protein
MQKINIMISSRLKTEILNGEVTIPLANIRTELKSSLETEELFSNRIYSVWISEEPRDASALESAWNECMSQVERSDIFVCIFTGEGGWATEKGDIGICHAELETAINKEPSKVFIINAIDALANPKNASDPVNSRMIEYVNKVNRFYNKAASGDDIHKITKDIVSAATVNLAKMGKREARKGKYSFGEALDWTRMSFLERKSAIEDEITSQFIQSGHELNDGCVAYRYGRKKYMFVVHGVPSGMSVSSAREMVGQPFLTDHELASKFESRLYGPIHIIGVHKGATEQNAISTLGHPDAVVVKGSYGVYIADNIQNIQMVLLAQCRDSASTRHNVQKFIDWLQESGEDSSLFMRAERRRQLLDVIIKQQGS